PAEPVMGRERPDEKGRAQESGGEDARRPRGLPVLPLRQPQHGMQGREDEDERVRVRRPDEETDDAEGEQRAAVAGQPLLRQDRPSREQTATRHDPADSGKYDEGDKGASGPADVGKRRRPAAAPPPEAE